MKRPEGVRFLHYTTLTLTNGVVTYGEWKPLPGLEDVSTTNVYATVQAFSDNQLDTHRNKPTSVDLAIILAGLKAADEAIIMGQKYAAGKKVLSTHDIQKAIALAYQQTNSDGTYTNKVFYNCNLSKDGMQNTTTGESVEFDRINLTGKAIPLENGDIGLEQDSDDPTVNPEELANFFKRVILPEGVEGRSLMRSTEKTIEEMLAEYEETIKRQSQEIETLRLKKEQERKAKERLELGKSKNN